MAKEWDFSGYATKNDLACSDGRTIRRDAFKHNDGQIVPLVWQHMHNEPANIVGRVLLENREDGVYAYGKFNDTENGKNTKQLVEHGDITALSIYANQLKQQGNNVLHGVIREVSLVLAGANQGALIDNLSFSHSDGAIEVDLEEAIIYTGLSLDTKEETAKHEDTSTERTPEVVFATFNEEQKDLVLAMIADVIENAGGEVKHSEEEEEEEKEEKEDKEEKKDEEIKHSDEGGNTMKHNVFDKEKNPLGTEVSKDLGRTILSDAKDAGSLKAVLKHADQTYGINNIEILFPDAQNVSGTPTFVTRDMAWVSKVLNATRHTPFSRIKTFTADITLETARAKGYVKGALKTNEFFAILNRITTPKTIYKKQKLDRDDIIDITDFDVVAWIRAEMRVMLNEEVARAILIGDGRLANSPDKIDELNIRPIATDDNFYAHKVEVLHAATTVEIMEAIIRSRSEYKGKGNPDMFTTTSFLTDMLLLKDTLGRRLYATKTELQSALMVNEIIEVPVMAGVTRTTDGDGVAGADRVMDLLAIIVNLQDYTIGSDRGGEITAYNDFDIDYNQEKYLLETRISGALTDPKTALIIERAPVVA